MRKYGLIAGVCAALTLGASTASAQNASKIGLTMSSGSAIGVLVPIGDNAAIRPTLIVARTTSDYEGSQFIEDSISSTTFVPGASVLFYLKTWGDTRVYVSPQYSYQRTSSSRDEDDPRGTHNAAFMIGGQHGLGDRFGVFAEAGLGWTRHKSVSFAVPEPASVTTTNWSTRATVGGILFF